MATATRRELRLGVDSLVAIDLEPDNGGIVLGMSESGMRISVAYPLVKQTKVRFTLHLSPKQKISGTGFVQSVSSSGRSAEVEILDLDEDSRAEFGCWLSGSPAEADARELPKPPESPALAVEPEAVPAVPVLEMEQPALVLDSPLQEAIAEAATALAPAEEHAVKAESRGQLEIPSAAAETAEWAAPSEALAPAATLGQNHTALPEPLSTAQPSFVLPEPIPVKPLSDGAAVFPVLLDGVTDAAAGYVALGPALLDSAEPDASQKTVLSVQSAVAPRGELRGNVLENPVKRVVPFAASVPARPATEPEPGEKDDFAAPAPELVAIEEGRMAGALYLPNYNVEGITACGTDWRWKVHLYSHPLMTLEIAAEKFEEFGWSLERDWHIWVALATIGAGFLPLVTKPPLVPVTLVLWLIGGRVAIRRRQPERAGERS